ncbi:MAG TPA: sugar ABC transporter permease [Actinophytocola sp.]|jgi:multiple sugar transport system permease protein|uniref:carbohydrate ABC transporter permease n=1 Tax=Actinophytocola sp. TaxID=1872138 RepID=UPI002E090BBE|nr:sugar ABC transporter permease [Actinophytocola sp.]
MGTQAIAVRTPRVRRAVTERARLTRGRSGIWFTLPFLLAYAAFLVWPLVLGVKMSLSNDSLSGTAGGFVGLRNFGEALTDAAVWQSLWHTAWFTILSTPPLVVLGLVMALLANHLTPARWLWRLAYFAPFLLPVAVVSLLWTWLFQPGFGLFDGMLSWLGVHLNIGWLTDPDAAMPAIVLTTLWWTVGFNFLLYLAALQTIPPDLYEASALDGAGWWRQLRHVTLPMLRRTTVLIVVLQLLASLKVFDQIYLMTQGGPNHATRPVIQYVYEASFTGYRTGYGTAISYVFFALILVVTVSQLRLFRARDEETTP